MQQVVRGRIDFTAPPFLIPAHELGLGFVNKAILASEDHAVTSFFKTLMTKGRTTALNIIMFGCSVPCGSGCVKYEAVSGLWANMSLLASLGDPLDNTHQDLYNKQDHARCSYSGRLFH